VSSMSREARDGKRLIGTYRVDLRDCIYFGLFWRRFL
jgi:hypothetical protein